MSSFARFVVASVFVLMGLAGLTASPAAALLAGPEADHDPWIALFPGDAEPILHDSSIPVWDREEGVVIAGPSEAQLDGLRAQGIEPVFSAPDRGEDIHVLSHDRYFTPPVLPGVVRFEINHGAMLYLFPAGLRADLPRLKFHGLFHGVPRVALAPVRVHPADAAVTGGGAVAPQALLAPIPLVQQIVDATSQASWFQFVRDLSGDSDVTIPGFWTAWR